MFRSGAGRVQPRRIGRLPPPGRRDPRFVRRCRCPRNSAAAYPHGQMIPTHGAQGGQEAATELSRNVIQVSGYFRLRTDSASECGR